MEVMTWPNTSAEEVEEVSLAATATAVDFRESSSAEANSSGTEACLVYTTGFPPLSPGAKPGGAMG